MKDSLVRLLIFIKEEFLEFLDSFFQISVVFRVSSIDVIEVLVIINEIDTIQIVSDELLFLFRSLKQFHGEPGYWVLASELEGSIKMLCEQVVDAELFDAHSFAYLRTCHHTA